MAVQGHLNQTSLRTTPLSMYVLTGLAVAAIWVSVVLATIFAPDMITGSQQEHLPIVGWTYWIWGLIATGSVLLAAQRAIRMRVTDIAPWAAFSIAVAIVWVGVMLVAIFAPVFVTGSDPTRLPLAAVGVPILGVILTWGVCRFFETATAPTS